MSCMQNIVKCTQRKTKILDILIEFLIGCLQHVNVPTVTSVLCST